MSLFLTLLKFAARGVYCLFKLLPAGNKVVLISRKNRQTSIDFRLLAKTLAADYPDTQVVILNHPLGSPLRSIWNFISELYHLATARGAIIDSYLPSVSILRHKPNLRIIQIWHALGAIKKFGRQILDQPEGSSKKLAEAMNMHGNYSFVTVGSNVSSKAFSEGFGVKKAQVKPVGEPRVDYLIDRKKQAENRAKVLSAYPELKGKRVVLYAPTFRKASGVAVETLVDAFDPAKYALLYSPHRLDKTKLEGLKGLVLNERFDVLELLPAADAVVTDYSAVVFEAAVLKKPLYFYAYDLDKYIAARGLNVDYEKVMPGPIVKDAQALAAAVEGGQADLKAVERFAGQYVSVQDGSSSKKIIKLLDL